MSGYDPALDPKLIGVVGAPSADSLTYEQLKERGEKAFGKKVFTIGTLEGQRMAGLGLALRAIEMKKALALPEKKPEEYTGEPRKIRPEDMAGIIKGTLKVGAHASCHKCNGRGVYGFKSVTNIPVMCPCARILNDSIIPKKEVSE